MTTSDNPFVPKVLVLGATGMMGSRIAELLDQNSTVTAVRAVRDPAKLAEWKAEGKEAVQIDLNDPTTFPAALEGIDRLFIATGYTIEMVHQVKTIVDAAVDVGVGFIVHLGVFGNGRSTDPHFAWHELVERYIAGSGIPWCNLHPHMFMENLLTVMRLREDTLVWPVGDKPVGWIAGEDIAAVGALVLAEGPDRHVGSDLFMSTELMNGAQAAEVLTGALGRPIRAIARTPAELAAGVAAGAVTLPANIDGHYGASILEWARQTYDGRMDYGAITTDAVQRLLSRPPMTLAQWAQSHRTAL
jgi:NAD(P)H dehydrogenase (quinone)